MTTNTPADIGEQLQQLWQRPLARLSPLAAHASKRQMYRLSDGAGHSAIAVINDDMAENSAFISFAQGLGAAGIAVPEIYAVSADKRIYIQQDLGSTTLMDQLQNQGEEKSLRYFSEAVSLLARLQTVGLAAIDRRLCLEGARYDSDAILRDIAYFETWYTKTKNIAVDSDALRADAETLAARADGYKGGFFMHRDYQSRNLMIHPQSDAVYVIDFQAAREGPLAYDLASLLNQSKAALSPTSRQHLLRQYLADMPEQMRGSTSSFEQSYWLFSLTRKVQNLGAYGRFGLRGGKSYFTQSIPLALKDIKALLDSWPDNLDCPALRGILTECIGDA